MSSHKGGQRLTVKDEEGGQAEVFCYQDLILPGSFTDWFDPEEKLESIRQFKYREGDILQCSYPKSGNHWLTNLLTLMLSKGSLETATSVNVSLIDFTKPTERLHKKPSPRIITSHLKFERLPEEHIRRGGKVILLVRNPKDVAVSYYYHGNKDRFLRFSLSWRGCLGYFCEGKVPFGSYFDYLNNWQKVLQQRKDLDIHVVYYETLKQQTLLELQRIQKYLGIYNDDDRLNAIIAKCSFSSLKSDVDSGKLRTLLVDKTSQPFIYRKGEIGDWMNHFTVTQNEAFESVIKNKLQGSIFQFQYIPNVPKHQL
ncbi:sulfotransferase 1B1-like [Mercenaria mercenaria]|uniref:sulfotransferase 1B1-like n=1 Tax=Mercenaria mercenaria TaxID=6596 RepID=UPI00234F3D09|nr:sulfotransferase 1B1-like [Mercenaria mercenaria]XP_045197984.2 sulfotransferase 1B1-like [Mercenaria mercenaria]XP_045197992.2 sulfotransferase 1B1-like [Mercenaria mercenaria]